MRKNRIILLFMIFIYILILPGCADLNSTKKDNIIAPNNNMCPIEGTWKIEFNEKNIDKRIKRKFGNRDIVISPQYIILGNEVCKNPQYKTKTVNVEEYFLYKLRLKYKELDINKKEVEIISTSSEDKPFYDFIKISEDKMLVYVDNELLCLTKKSINSSIEDNRKIINGNSNNNVVLPKKPDLLRTGVLIGLKSTNDDSVDEYKNYKKYRTLWVSSKNKELKDIIEINNLFVPRKNGFCTVKANRKEKFNHTQDLLSVKFLYNDYFIKNNFMKEDNIENKDIYRDILFVSNDYICIEYSEFYKNNPVNLYKVKMLPIDNISASMGLSIREVIEKDSEKILKSSMESYLKSKTQDTVNNLEKKPREDSFFFNRRNGHWIMKGRLNGIEDKEDYMNFNINVSIPKKMLNYDDLKLPWNTIKSKVPNALDAYTSPNKDLAIIVTQNKLYVYIIDGDKLSNKSVREIDINNEKVVMAEWVTGDYVKRWKNTILKDSETSVIK